MGNWFVERRHWCMSILRIYLGVGLFIKGVDFVTHRDELMSMMEANDVVWSGAALAHVVILTHLAGGTMMAIGFGTRIGSLIQLPTLFGAVFMIRGDAAVSLLGVTEQLRFSALVLVLLVLFVWHGSGPLSLKAQLERSPGR